MTVRLTRTFEVAASPETVWDFLADPEQRAAAISAVRDWNSDDDGAVTWHLELPLPLTNTITITTRDTARDPGKHVQFTGRSDIVAVRGEHRLTAIESGTEVVNEFVVDGKAPGVETVFKQRFPAEFQNLQDALVQFIQRKNS